MISYAICFRCSRYFGEALLFCVFPHGCVFFRTQMSGACGPWGVEINNVRSAKQHADFLTKPLQTEAFRFHRTWDELVVISCADFVFVL